MSGELEEAWTMADHREMDGCENDLEVEWTESGNMVLNLKDETLK